MTERGANLPPFPPPGTSRVKNHYLCVRRSSALFVFRDKFRLPVGKFFFFFNFRFLDARRRRSTTCYQRSQVFNRACSIGEQ